MTIPEESRLEPSSPSAGDAAQSVASTARHEGRAVVDTARTETANRMSQARFETRRQGDEQVRRLAERLQDVGDQLDGVRRGEAPQGSVANVLGEAGDRASQLAERLQTGGIDGVTRDVKQFARQRPGVFLLGAFALGIAAGRTLRNADTHALVEAAKPSDSPATTSTQSSSAAPAIPSPR
jgi:hypothetical protein